MASTPAARCPSIERRGETPVDQARCMVNTSLNGYTTTGSGTPPAIFRRRPQNADGNYIYDPTDPDNHITELINKGAMDQIEADPFSDTWQLSNLPKNAFYAGTEWLITTNIFNSMIAQGIDAQDMVNEMNRGDGLYEAGKGVPTSNGGYYLDAQQKLHQGFYDEWDFHNYMNQGTQATTAGQSREFRRRNDQLVQAVGQLADAMKCLYSNALDIPPGGCAGSNIPNALGKVNPGDEQEYEHDPLQMNSILSAIMPSQLALPPSLFGQVGFGASLQPAQYTLAQLASLNLVSGAQNIPESAHAPGLLSADAQTNSILLGALDLPPGLVAHAPAVEIEDLAATQARLADIASAQQVMQINNLGNIGLGLGLLDELGVLLDGNARANASTHKAVPGPNLADYVQTYTPNPGTIQNPTSFLVEMAWNVNPPRWGTDTNTGLPVLDCSTTRVREGGGTTNLNDYGDVPESAGVISTLVVDGTYHTDQMWPALCQVTNLLLQEWERAQVGNPSCLDKNSVSCDWVPQDFVDRFVTQNVGYASAAKEIEYSYCKRWTGGGQIDSTVKDTKGNLVDGVPQSRRPRPDRLPRLPRRARGGVREGDEDGPGAGQRRLRQGEDRRQRPGQQ